MSEIKKKGVVAVIPREGRLLLIRRSSKVPAPGRYCFPGGALEEGETEEQALIRELEEELNITICPLRRVWESVTDWGVHLSWWQSRLETAAQPIPNTEEVSEVLWLPVPEILRLPGLLSSNREFLRKVASGEIVLDGL